MVCGSLYGAGSIRKPNPNATIDVMGALLIEIPPNLSPDPGIRTPTLRLGQAVVRLSSLGDLPYAGFSFSECIALMLPTSTKIRLRVGVFADNLSRGQFLDWQVIPNPKRGATDQSSRLHPQSLSLS